MCPYIVDQARPLKIVVYLQRSSPLSYIRLVKTGRQMDEPYYTR